MKMHWRNTHKILAQGGPRQTRIKGRQTRFAQGKPGLPRNAQFAKNRHLNNRHLKIVKILLLCTPGLPPLPPVKHLVGNFSPYQVRKTP
jgi:hypothetical protein